MTKIAYLVIYSELIGWLRSKVKNLITSANELKLCCEAMGFMRVIICSHASKTAAPYISELAEAAVGEALGT